MPRSRSRWSCSPVRWSWRGCESRSQLYETRGARAAMTSRDWYSPGEPSHVGNGRSMRLSVPGPARKARAWSWSDARHAPAYSAGRARRHWPTSGGRGSDRGSNPHRYARMRLATDPAVIRPTRWPRLVSSSANVCPVNGMTHLLRACSMRDVYRAGLLGAAIGVGAFNTPPADSQPTSAASGRPRTASADPATCPIKASSVIPSGDSWAFTEAGPPSTPHPGITSSYSHGRGTWTHGRGAGIICHEDSAPGRSSRNLVLTVTGSSQISPRITRLGRLGVGLTLHVTVSASDDQTCLSGTRGTVTLFASYYQEHHDSVQLHFAGGCTTYDYTYVGSHLSVLIAENGHQVNSA